MNNHLNHVIVYCILLYPCPQICHGLNTKIFGLVGWEQNAWVGRLGAEFLDGWVGLLGCMTEDERAHGVRIYGRKLRGTD